MGLLDKLKSWLFKAEDPRKAMRRAKIKLRLFIKRIDRQRLKLEAQAKAAKKRAVELRKKGEGQAAKNYVKSFLQFNGWARGIEKFKLQLDALAFKIETASNMTELSDTLVGVGQALNGLMNLKLPNMEEVLSSIDMNLEEFNLMFETTDEAMEMMGATDDVEVNDKMINEAMDEIDAEILIETSEQLPTAQGTRVSGLQDELRRLRDEKLQKNG
ncbi:MAG: Snf7 family protein [Promethearchaeota archaeon]